MDLYSGKQADVDTTLFKKNGIRQKRKWGTTDPKAMGNWQQKSDNILASFYQESQEAERIVNEWDKHRC